jgi:hypothetical protein
MQALMDIGNFDLSPQTRLVPTIMQCALSSWHREREYRVDVNSDSAFCLCLGHLMTYVRYLLIRYDGQGQDRLVD